MVSRLEGGLRAVCAAALLALFALVVAQVVLRYGFGYTPFFTEEMARYMLVWSVLAGAAVSVDDHIRVPFVPDLLRPAVRRVWMLALDFATLLLLAVLTFAAVRSFEFAAGQTSDGLQIPLQYPYAALPLAFGAGLLFLAVRLKRGFRKERE